MASYSTSVTLVSVHYDGGDTEAYAPDRVYISSANSETGALTVCFESTDEEKKIYLTLSAHRSVAPVSGKSGVHIVRIFSGTARIYLCVNSATAQHYWMDVLACSNPRNGMRSVATSALPTFAYTYCTDPQAIALAANNNQKNGDAEINCDTRSRTKRASPTSPSTILSRLAATGHTNTSKTADIHLTDV